MKRRHWYTGLGVNLVAAMLLSTVWLCAPAAQAAEELRNAVAADTGLAEARGQVVARLVALGYSEERARAAMAEFSDDEIRLVAARPGALRKTGAAAALLIILCIIATMSSQQSKSSASTPTPPQPTPTPPAQPQSATCTACNGTGKAMVRCSDCKGTGKSGIKDDWNNEQDCKACKGKGEVQQSCSACGGTGRVSR